MKVKTIFTGIMSGILVCLVLLLTVTLHLLAVIARTIVGMAHRIR